MTKNPGRPALKISSQIPTVIFPTRKRRRPCPWVWPLSASSEPGANAGRCSVLYFADGSSLAPLDHRSLRSRSPLNRQTPHFCRGDRKESTIHERTGIVKRQG